MAVSGHIICYVHNVGVVPHHFAPVTTINVKLNLRQCLPHLIFPVFFLDVAMKKMSLAPSLTSVRAMLDWLILL